MDNIRNSFIFTDIGDAARRQYINSTSVFTALEEARKTALQYRGGMYWKTHSSTGIQYLTRTQANNSQKIIGSLSDETTAMFDKFSSAKEAIKARISDLNAEADQHRKLNRVYAVGRAPQILVEILNMLSHVGISEHFKVVGTHAIYAYEAAAGVRIEKDEALATNDVDLLWAIGKRIRFQTQMQHNELSMIALLKKVDKTFEIRKDQRYTAVNSKGFEVDILRRETGEDTVGKTNPSRMTHDDDDFLAIKASTAGVLDGAQPFSAIIVSANGLMARMHTVSPLEFIKVKRWLASAVDRDSMKRSRDQLQAELVEELVNEYLPNLLAQHTNF